MNIKVEIDEEIREAVNKIDQLSWLDRDAKARLSAAFVESLIVRTETPAPEPEADHGQVLSLMIQGLQDMHAGSKKCGISCRDAFTLAGFEHPCSARFREFLDAVAPGSQGLSKICSEVFRRIGNPHDLLKVVVDPFREVESKPLAKWPLVVVTLDMVGGKVPATAELLAIVANTVAMACRKSKSEWATAEAIHVESFCCNSDLLEPAMRDVGDLRTISSIRRWLAYAAILGKIDRRQNGGRWEYRANTMDA